MESTKQWGINMKCCVSLGSGSKFWQIQDISKTPIAVSVGEHLQTTWESSESHSFHCGCADLRVYLWKVHINVSVKNKSNVLHELCGSKISTCQHFMDNIQNKQMCEATGGISWSFVLNLESSRNVGTFQSFPGRGIYKGPMLNCKVEILFPEQGLEPWTLRLKVWCSTDWAIQALCSRPSSRCVAGNTHFKQSQNHSFSVLRVRKCM